MQRDGDLDAEKRGIRDEVKQTLKFLSKFRRIREGLGKCVIAQRQRAGLVEQGIVVDFKWENSVRWCWVKFIAFSQERMYVSEFMGRENSGLRNRCRVTDNIPSSSMLLPVQRD